MSIVVLSFDLAQALNGALVTVSGYEDKYTGRLRREGKDLSQFVVYMAGSRLVVGDDGTVRSCIPSLTGVTAGTTVLGIYTESTTEDMHYKSRGYIPSEHQETGYTDEVELRSMQMRDHFALTALGVIMQRLDHPEAADDETCLHYSRVAYRWATGMMQAALASREGVKVPDEDQGDEKELVEVDTDELANTTEKLLYNIAATLENIKKQDQDHYDDTHTEDDELKISIAALGDMMTQDDELKVTVTDMPAIDINSMPEETPEPSPEPEPEPQ